MPIGSESQLMYLWTAAVDTWDLNNQLPSKNIYFVNSIFDHRVVGKYIVITTDLFKKWTEM